jgi:hypothetical protein
MARETGLIQCLTRGEPRDGLHVEDLADILVDYAVGRRVHHDVYLKSYMKWGCVDTAMVMGVPIDTTMRWTGWLGDTQQPPEVGNVLVCDRSSGDGVRDALKSLGWPA